VPAHPSKPATPPRKKAVSRPAPASAPATVQPEDSLVQQTQTALRARIRAAADSDVFIGSEAQLIAELGVSRPTFRQAARLLEHEQLLRIKRGIGGGFFTRLPSPGSVSRMAASYLHAQGTTLQQVDRALAPMVIEAAGLLAEAGEASRTAFTDFVREHHGFEDTDAKNRARVVQAFDGLLGSLCGNPTVALMLSLRNDLLRDPRGLRINPQQAQAQADFQRKLAAAVARADAKLARRVTAKHIELASASLPRAARVQG